MNAADPFLVEDLAAADRKDADRLAKARDELAKREAALTAAEDQVAAAKAGIIAAGVDGKDDTKHAEALATANAAVVQAREIRDLRAEIVDTIERELVASVRAERAAPIEARLEAIRSAHDEQVELLSAVAATLERLQTLAAAERAAAAELASARRDGMADRLHGFVAGTGNRYVSIPDVRVGFHVVEGGARQDVESPGHLVDKLRRRQA